MENTIGKFPLSLGAYRGGRIGRPEIPRGSPWQDQKLYPPVGIGGIPREKKEEALI